jgi:hypothetical protein
MDGTYVNPLTNLNSLMILPPWSVTVFLALSSSRKGQTFVSLSLSFSNRHPAREEDLRFQLAGVGAVLEGDLSL